MKKRKLTSLMLTGAIAFTGAFSMAPGIMTYAADSVSFTKKQVTAYNKDNKVENGLTCMFRSDMPNVPFVDVEQYLDLVYGADSDYTITGSGSQYSVIGTNKNTNKTGSTMHIDTAKDTMTIDGFYSFIVGKFDGTMVDFASYTPEKVMDEPAVEYDFKTYGIDLYSEDGRAYVPLSTMWDIFNLSLTYSEYINGNIYMSREDETTSGPTATLQELEKECLNTITREPDVVDYSYRELGFMLENLYGRPGKAVSQEFVKKLEKKGGFDETLTNGGVIDGIDLSVMKKYLQSTNKAEFTQGLFMLDNLLFDGGHAFFSNSLFDAIVGDENRDQTELAKEYDRLFKNDQDARSALVNIANLNNAKPLLGMELGTFRDNSFGTPIKEWDDENGDFVASLYLIDNTAVFRFDAFTNNVIRLKSGDKPFNDALNLAKKKKCDNFVLDLTTNGGGSDQVMEFLLSVMFEGISDYNGKSYYYHVDPNTGFKRKDLYSVDKNLDGVIDAKDDAVKYGFNYAIMISGHSFSCGNTTPCLAHEAGIPLLGDTTGGGGCNVSTLSYPGENNNYRLSTTSVMATSDYVSCDAGVAPDYKMLSVTDDGTITDASVYDPTKLVSTLNKHFNIAKKANTIKVKTKTQTVKAKKVAKKSVKVKNAVVISNAKGTVTCTKKSGSKKLNVAKDGTITVKKGTKKGTYKVKVKVKCSGTGYYKAFSKTVTATIKVK